VEALATGVVLAGEEVVEVVVVVVVEVVDDEGGPGGVVVTTWLCAGDDGDTEADLDRDGLVDRCGRVVLGSDVVVATADGRCADDDGRLGVTFGGRLLAPTFWNQPFRKLRITTISNTVASARITTTEPPIDRPGRSRRLFGVSGIPPGAVGVRKGSCGPG
jgi:hypothetical protein